MTDYGERLAGDYRDRATPVPIPNTVVKPVSADGTATARSRESRPPPASLRECPMSNDQCTMIIEHWTFRILHSISPVLPRRPDARSKNRQQLVAFLNC